MQFEVEIVVRSTGQVVSEKLYHDGSPPERWEQSDVTAVLTAMLLAIDRAVTGDPNRARSVAFRGISWIVSPFEDGVALAIEIPSGSVVAGPFQIPEDRLSTLITTALSLP